MAAIVELCGFGGGVSGDSSGRFQASAVLEIVSDTCGPKSVTTELWRQLCAFCAAFYHAQNVGDGHAVG